MSDASRPVGLIPFAPQYRASGVLVHITSLPSPYAIGDVGPAAFAMVDRLQQRPRAGGRRFPSALRVTAIRLTNACLLLRATDCSSARAA
jgi:hypothetical protein